MTTIEHADEIMAIVTELDVTRQRTLIGDGPNRLFKRIMSFLQYSGGVDLVGSSGTGKSHLAEIVCCQYALENGVPAYFIQGDAQTTKSSTIGGRQMVSGGRVMPLRAAIAEAMVRGGIVFFDELTHAPKMFLTALNTILDPSSKTYIGGMLVEADPKFRVVSCHNTAKYSGNTPLPPSLASRLVAFPIGYPTMEEEMQIGIQIALETIYGPGYQGTYDLTAPMPVVKYATWLLTSMRNENALIPVSARNLGKLLTLLHTDAFLLDTKAGVAPHFTGANSKSTTTSIAEKVLWKDHSKINNMDLMHKDVSELKQWVSCYGVEDFRNAVAACYCLNLDIDGISLVALDSLRTKLIGSII